MNDVVPSGGDSAFSRIRRVNPAGNEYWSSRDLSSLLGYAEYRNFEPVLEKAKVACFNSGHRVEDHFVDVHEMIEIGKGGQRAVAVVYLSRYACYLIVQNADPSKPIVAIGQTYFAIQTRRQELADQGITDEDEQRLRLRDEMKIRNRNLAAAAKRAGVTDGRDYAIFQNHGYQGLYGGLSMQDIHRRKGLKKSQQILDHMGGSELAANLFRATQAHDKIRREGITSKERANAAHHEIGVEVRKTIRRMGGTMPENLPTPKVSAKQLESRKKKQGNKRLSAKK